VEAAVRRNLLGIAIMVTLARVHIGGNSNPK